MNPTLGTTENETLIGWHLTRPDGTPASGAITGPKSPERDAALHKIVLAARTRNMPVYELNDWCTREGLIEVVRHVRTTRDDATRLLVVEEAPHHLHRVGLVARNELISLLDRVGNPPVGVVISMRDSYHNVFGRLRDQQHLEIPGAPFQGARYSLDGAPYSHLNLSSDLTPGRTS